MIGLLCSIFCPTVAVSLHFIPNLRLGADASHNFSKGISTIANVIAFVGIPTLYGILKASFFFWSGSGFSGAPRLGLLLLNGWKPYLSVHLYDFQWVVISHNHLARLMLPGRRFQTAPELDLFVFGWEADGLLRKTEFSTRMIGAKQTYRSTFFCNIVAPALKLSQIPRRSRLHELPIPASLTLNRTCRLPTLSYRTLKQLCTIHCNFE